MPRLPDPSLETLDVFEGFRPQDLGIIGSALKARNYKPGEFIVLRGEAFPIIGVIREGIALVVSSNEAEKDAILAFLLPTDFIAKPDRSPAHFDIIAAGEVRVDCMPLETFLHLINTNPEIARNSLSLALDRLELVQDWIVKANQLDAKGRLKNLIALMALRSVQAGLAKPDAQISLPLPVSRETIGNLLGLGLYTVSRLMGEIKSEGLINFDDPHFIVIPDLDRFLTEAGYTRYNPRPISAENMPGPF